MATMFVRITKAAARKRFNAGDKLVYLCPCKMRPGFPWNMAMPVTGKEYLASAESYRGHPDLWQGTIEATAWDLLYNNWAFYNASHETGYYAHYYIQVDR